MANASDNTKARSSLFVDVRNSTESEAATGLLTDLECKFFMPSPDIQLLSTLSTCLSSWTATTALPSACSASPDGTARKALSLYDLLLRSLEPLCTPSRKTMRCSDVRWGHLLCVSRAVHVRAMRARAVSERATHARAMRASPMRTYVEHAREMRARQAKDAHMYGIRTFDMRNHVRCAHVWCIHAPRRCMLVR
eukprot:2185911-Pleurochrysis_carterae.AAC.3